MLITTPIMLDWKGIFSDVVTKAAIPNTSFESLTKGVTIIRDLYVDLLEIQQKLMNAGITPTQTYIYADVIRIPEGFSWTLENRGLVLVARRIEVMGRAQVFLNYRNSTDAVFSLYIGELEGDGLSAEGIQSVDGTDRFVNLPIVAIPGSIGLKASLVNDTPTLTPVKQFSPAFLAQESQLQYSLVSNFQVSMVLYDDKPDIAGALLHWIQSCTAQADHLIEMFIQASALLARLTASSSRYSFVPYLSPAVYQKEAGTFYASAKEFESQYIRFSDKNASIEDRKAAAQLMLSHYEDTSNFQNNLIQQRWKNLNNAQQEADIAKLKIRFQQETVTSAQINLETGIKKWDEQHKIEAAFAIIGAVFDFAAAMAAVVVTDGAASGEAVKAADGAIKAAKAAKATQQSIMSMQELKKLVESINATFKVVQSITKSVTDLQAALSLRDQIQDLPAAQLHDSQDEWTKFQLETDAIIQPLIDKEVEGATEYKLQMDILCIYGQSLITAQYAVIQNTQQYATLVMQQKVSQNQIERLKEYIQNFNEQEQENTGMMQMIYERYLDVKRSLFIALEDYVAAYCYWSLSTSALKPSMVSNVSEMIVSLNKMELDYTNALSRFNPPPEDFSNLVVKISDPEWIAGLQKNNLAVVHLDLSEKAFRGLDRVRILEIHVWLDGVDTTESIQIGLTASGSYLDRYRNEEYQFSGVGVKRSFIYRLVNGIPQIIMSGKVTDETQYAYFQPTPFTTWTIDVPSVINLSSLSQVRLEFKGSTITNR